jgi:protein-S-isoprenylcysteine O-methyltransferase Ste14
MQILFPLIRTLIYAILVYFGWRYVAIQARGFDRFFKIELPQWATGVGVLLLVVGFLLAAICFFEFVIAGKGTFIHFDAPKKFVVSGAYKYVRNPMYLGVLLIFIGHALLLRSISVLILSILLFLLAHLVVVFIEEPNLENKFGEDYVNYKRLAGRWVPKIKRRPSGN